MSLVGLKADTYSSTSTSAANSKTADAKKLCSAISKYVDTKANDLSGYTLDMDFSDYVDSNDDRVLKI